MDSDITYQQYWQEIQAVAQSVTEEAREYGREISEVLHETIDGHQWVIYTAYNYDVAKQSPNDDAWQEVYGGEVRIENFNAVRAYFAMYQDVCEHSDFGGE